MNRPVPQVLVDFARDFAKDRFGAGHHCFNACTVCGGLVWRSSDPSAPDGVTVEWFHEERLCEGCQMAAYRHPEVFHWVCRVLSFWTAPGVLSPPPTTDLSCPASAAEQPVEHR